MQTDCSNSTCARWLRSTQWVTQTNTESANIVHACATATQFIWNGHIQLSRKSCPVMKETITWGSGSHRLRWWRRRIDIASESNSGIGKVLLELDHLPLQKRDVADAAKDRVSESCLGFIGEWVDCIASEFEGDLVEDLGDVARAKNLVHVGELLGLIGSEIRREGAVWGAPSLEEFAGSTRRGGGASALHLTRTAAATSLLCYLTTNT